MTALSRPWPKSIFSQRPAQLRPFEVQWRATGLAESYISPIEQKFGRALLALLLDPTEFGPPAYINLFLPTTAAFKHSSMPPITKELVEGVINVMPQVKVGAYVADFGFHVKAYNSRQVVFGVVECDGHDFHDRTPKQVAYDRRRDRFMQERGVCVLRFPSFEIHDNAEKCAREAINVLLRKSLLKGH